MKAKSLTLVFVLLCLLLAACTAAQTIPEAGMAVEDDSPANAGQTPAVTGTGEQMATTTDAPATSTATAEPASAESVDSRLEPAVTPVTEIEHHADPPAPVLYRNETYSFRLTLPGTWAEYQATANAHGDGSSVCFSFPNHGPVCVLQVDVYSKAAWNELSMKPPNYYLDENEQYVFAAGPYQQECVQLDDFQCARYREIPEILAGFVAESTGPDQPPPVLYRNETYGFRLTLPETWAGYQTIQHEHADVTHICFTFPNYSPVCVLQIDAYTRAAWDRMDAVPPDYYRGENDQYVFGAGPYDGTCVQLDDFQCARHLEIPGILSGLVAESVGSGQPAPIPYRNETYGFHLTLPGTWAGYQATQNGGGDLSAVCFSFPDHGPLCVLQVDVFTKAAWNELEMKPPNYYLDENEQYVFAAEPGYPTECVQLDAFQCDRYQEISGILAGFVAESIGPGPDIPYRNDTYGFSLTLPGTWAGHQATVDDQGNRSSVCFSFPDYGPICVLQVDVYTKAAWNNLAMKPANYYLNENEQYVFAAGPYQPQCVQLDDFQCARYQEIPGILAGFVAE